MESTLDSIQSIALQSGISQLSVATLSTVGQDQPITSAESVSMTSAPTTSETSSHASDTLPTDNSQNPSKPSSTARKGTPTSVPPNSGSTKGGISPPVVAIIIVLLVAAAFVGGWFFYQWRRNHRRRTKSGLWLESGKYLDQIKKQSSEGKVTSPYTFGGMGNSGPFRQSFGPGPHPPPTPPTKDLDPGIPSPRGMDQFEPVSPPVISSPTDPFAKVTPGVPRCSTPMSVATGAQPLSRSPSPLPPASSPYVPRPDSGPVLLYSTPKSAPEPPGSQDVAPVSGSGLNAASPSLSVPAPVAGIPMTPPPAYFTQASNSPISASISLSSTSESPPMTPPALNPIKPLNISRPLRPATSQSQRALSPPAPQRPPTNQSTEPRPIYPVVRIYLPTLLDELKINVGDLVRMINEFDDGWAYCEKVGDEDGAAGVVPLECLDRNAGMNIEGRPVSMDLSPPVGLGGPPFLPRRSSRYSSFRVDFDSASVA